MYLYLLALIIAIFTTSCMSNVGIKSTPIHSSSPSPALTSPMPLESPSPEVSPSSVPEGTYYIRNNPEKVCYNEEVTVTGKFGLDTIASEDEGSVYIENVTHSEGMVPPLRYQYILLAKIKVQAGKEFNYTFKVESNMKSSDGNSTLVVEPGSYAIYVKFLNGSLYGANGIEVRNCE